MNMAVFPSPIISHPFPIDAVNQFRWDFFGMFANECGAVIREKSRARLAEYGVSDPDGDDIDCEDSHGWGVRVLSNGGAFWYPASQPRYTLTIEENAFSGTFSAEAAGIVMTLLTLHHVASVARKDGADHDAEHLDTQQFRLREYVLQHPEASKIDAAIAFPVWQTEIADE